MYWVYRGDATYVNKSAIKMKGQHGIPWQPHPAAGCLAAVLSASAVTVYH